MKAYLILVPLCIAAFVGCASPTGVPVDLAQLLKTNAPCRVRLQPAWKGEAKHTVRTGWFTNADSAKLEKLERELRFDWFSYSDKLSPLNWGRAIISKGERGNGQSAIHSFRASLPTDAEIAGARTVSTLEKLFGPSQGFADGWGSNKEMRSSAGWAFFTLKDESTVETVSVVCMTVWRAGDTEVHVDSMKVTRGSATPKGK